MKKEELWWTNLCSQAIKNRNWMHLGMHLGMHLEKYIYKAQAHRSKESNKTRKRMSGDIFVKQLGKKQILVNYGV